MAAAARDAAILAITNSRAWRAAAADTGRAVPEAVSAHAPPSTSGSVRALLEGLLALSRLPSARRSRLLREVAGGTPAADAIDAHAENVECERQAKAALGAIASHALTRCRVGAGRCAMPYCERLRSMHAERRFRSVVDAARRAAKIPADRIVELQHRPVELLRAVSELAGGCAATSAMLLVRAGLFATWREAFEACRKERKGIKLNGKMTRALDEWAQSFPAGRAA